MSHVLSSIQALYNDLINMGSYAKKVILQVPRFLSSLQHSQRFVEYEFLLNSGSYTIEMKSSEPLVQI